MPFSFYNAHYFTLMEIAHALTIGVKQQRKKQRIFTIYYVRLKFLCFKYSFFGVLVDGMRLFCLIKVLKLLIRYKTITMNRQICGKITTKHTHQYKTK